MPFVHRHSVLLTYDWQLISTCAFKFRSCRMALHFHSVACRNPDLATQKDPFAKCCAIVRCMAFGIWRQVIFYLLSQLLPQPPLPLLYSHLALSSTGLVRESNLLKESFCHWILLVYQISYNLQIASEQALAHIHRGQAPKPIIQMSYLSSFPCYTNSSKTLNKSRTYVYLGADGFWTSVEIIN